MSATERVEGGCPRQAEGTLAIQREHVAVWNTDNWRDGDSWPEGFTRPRSCSYCGGVHPDDAISLVAGGWEIEPTTKSYKRYLHPPGHRRNMQKVVALIRARMLDDTPQEPEFVEPVPCVKLYSMHFNEDQVRRFNAAASPAPVPPTDNPEAP